jgi:hypothetical protein
MSESTSNMKYVRRHYHKSDKAGVVYCCSSYELKACLMLDENNDVAFYETQIHFEINGNKRIIDFIVYFKNGTKKIIEVKPVRRLGQFSEQIEDNRQYALDHGYDFIIWTETDLGFKNEYYAKKWADKYISELVGVDYVAYRKEMDSKRSKKYYHKHIATDKILVECQFCNCTHEALRLTHDKNVAKNGRYICEWEGGHIGGSKPKPKKIDPLAEQGLKKCNTCGRVLSLDAFSVKKCICKECRAKIYKGKYQQKKGI